MTDYSTRIVLNDLIRLKLGYRRRLRRYGIARGTRTIPCHEELSKDELRKTISALESLMKFVQRFHTDDVSLKHLQSQKGKPFIEK